MVVYQESRHSVGNVPAANLGPFPPILVADWLADRLAGKPFASEHWYVRSNGQIDKTAYCEASYRARTEIAVAAAQRTRCSSVGTGSGWGITRAHMAPRPTPPQHSLREWPGRGDESPPSSEPTVLKRRTLRAKDTE